MTRKSQRSHLARELRHGRRPTPVAHRKLPSQPGAPLFGPAWSMAGRAGLLPVYLLLLLALVGVGAYLMLDRIYAGAILPNVRIEGIAVGGMSQGAASAAIRARYAAWLRQPVELSFDGQRFTPSLRDLGVTLDLERSVGAAYAVGRNLNPALTGYQLYRVWSGGVDLPVQLRIDEARLEAYVGELATEIDTLPRDARLLLQGAQVLTTPAARGRRLLSEPNVGALTVALNRLTPTSLGLQGEVIEPLINDRDVAPVAERVATLLSAPLTLEAAGRSWVWTPEELSGLVRISHDAGTVRADLDREQLYRRVEQIAAEVTAQPKEPKLRWIDGAVQIIDPGQDGATINVDDSVTLLSEALWHPQRSLMLPGAVVRPRVTPETLADLGIVELVAEGKSAFPGSANYRITNIANGARLMDGVLIAPDEQFTFNELVEPVDESNGFVKGLAIVDNRTQQEWGGGLCQVSTTVFRAAFWAGLPIDERHEHSFRISWYEIYEPIGMDAAIFTGPGGNNLRFSNDTGHWLLMQTEVDRANATLIVRLYGTRPDRQVIQGEPVIKRRTPPPAKPVYINDPRLPAGSTRRTDIAQPGMELEISRTVVAGETVLRKDIFSTNFQPWPNIYVRGTRR